MGMDPDAGTFHSAEEVGTDLLTKQHTDRLKRLVTFQIGEEIEIKGGRFRLISIDVNTGQIKFLLLPKEDKGGI